jgi:hypothetical protein
MQTFYSLKQATLAWDVRPPRQRYPEPQPPPDNEHLVQQAAVALFGVCKTLDQIMASPGNRVRTIQMYPIEKVREVLRMYATDLMYQVKGAKIEEHDPGAFDERTWPYQDPTPKGTARGEGNVFPRNHMI